MILLHILLYCIFGCTYSFAQETAESTQNKKEVEAKEATIKNVKKSKQSSLVGGTMSLDPSINFDQIKDILKNDQLEKEVEIKKTVIKKGIKRSQRINKARYNIPTEKEIWSLLSEVWLVKNAPRLKWDFEKPDYGINKAIAKLFGDLGFYQKSLKILVLDTPVVQHFSLPANPNEFIFVLSLPFMRTMDLTKLEIALLVLEDFYRVKFNYFKNYVVSKDLKSILGTNFQGKKIDGKIIAKVMKNYDYMIFKKGFSFQQQYEVTKKVDQILKSDLKLWAAYIELLKKIDNLVKTNVLYKNYNEIYPSPEMQLKWLNPT